LNAAMKKMLLLFFIVSILLLFSTIDVIASAEGIDYYDIVIVRSIENGMYEYGNNDCFEQAANLQSVFDRIAEQTTGNAKIQFDLITTESVTIDYDKTFVFSGGTVVYNGSTFPFVTIASGLLRVQGVTMQSSSALIRVQSGATLDFVSGTVSLQQSSHIASAFYNYGTMYFHSATVEYVTNAVLASGSILYQSGTDAQTTVYNGYYSGDSVFNIMSGTLTVVDGIFKATGLSTQSSSNGYALRVSGGSKVDLQGGTFDSADLSRTIFLDGNSDSVVSWSGSTVNGRIAFNSLETTSSPTLIVGDHRLRAVPNGMIFLFSDELLTIENALLGVEPNRGFRFVKWSDDILEESPSLSLFNTNPILPVLSNRYTVSFAVDDSVISTTVVYGAEVDPGDLEIVVPAGCEISYWIDSNDDIISMPITVLEDGLYTAMLEIIPFEVSTNGDIKERYDGMAKELFATVEEIDGISYTYTWMDEDEVTIFTGKCLSLINVADSGSYRVQVEAIRGDISFTVLSDWQHAQIDKGIYNEIIHDTIYGQYDPLITLNSYLLEEGFSWLNPSVVPNVAQTNYDAIYCLDRDNYLPLFVSIKIILKKAAPVVQEHSTVFGGLYEPTSTLADYQFVEDEWRWADETISPNGGSHSYVAIYNPDSNNYDDYYTDVVLYLDKTEYPTPKPITIVVLSAPNLTVEIAMSQWSDSLVSYRLASESSLVLQKPLNALGDFVFDVYYNGDPLNYDDALTTMTITVNRGQVSAIHDEIVIPFVVDANLLSVELEDGWHWREDEVLVLGRKNYPAIYNPDENLYEDFSTVITLTTYKPDLDPNDYAYPDIYITYHEGLVLSEIVLDENYKWLNDSQVLSSGDFDISAVYFHKNYDQYINILIQVHIEKAEHDMSNFIFNDTKIVYDGKAHSIEWSSAPQGVNPKYVGDYQYTNVGLYQLEITFEIDSNNYKPIPNRVASLEISRTDYDMSTFVFVDQTFTYSGSPVFLEGTGTLPKGVSIDEYIGNGNIFAGQYMVQIRFKQEDSLNYNLIEPMTAVMTIEKAPSPIQGLIKQSYVYDGLEHVPNIMVANNEQSVICDPINGYTEIGDYSYLFTTMESANYFAGRKTVVMSIVSPLIKSIGAIEGSVYCADGVPNGSTLLFDIQDTILMLSLVDADGVALNLPMQVTVALPDNILWKLSAIVFTDEYETSNVEYTLTNGGVMFETNKTGQFSLVLDEGTPNKIQAWIIVVPIVVAIVVSAGIVGLVLWKKKIKKD